MANTMTIVFVIMTCFNIMLVVGGGYSLAHNPLGLLFKTGPSGIPELNESITGTVDQGNFNSAQSETGSNSGFNFIDVVKAVAGGLVLIVSVMISPLLVGADLIAQGVSPIIIWLVLAPLEAIYWVSVVAFIRGLNG